jgi:hypothetical protein
MEQMDQIQLYHLQAAHLLQQSVAVLAVTMLEDHSLELQGQLEPMVVLAVEAETLIELVALGFLDKEIVEDGPQIPPGQVAAVEELVLQAHSHQIIQRAVMVEMDFNLQLLELQHTMQAAEEAVQITLAETQV